jgi:perosamine synthetase
MTPQELRPAIDALHFGHLSEGRWVEQFEKDWASYVGCEYCVSFSSGSTALLGGLWAARQVGIIKDGPILTNPSTYVGTVNAITLAGFEVQFVDIEPSSFGTLATDQVRTELLHDTSIAAILPVHLFGLPENLPRIMALADASQIPVVEDAAQAHGSEIRGQKLGSLGLFSIFSFYMAHTVPGIEMGAVVTSDARLHRQLRSVKDQGRTPSRERESSNAFTAYSQGLNLKTNEVCAAVAVAHLNKLDGIIQQRLHNAHALTELLAEYSEFLQVPDFPDDTCPFAYPIVITSGPIGRDEVCASLRERGIQTRPMFPCIPTQQPAYSSLRAQYIGRLPNSEQISMSGFYVGCHEHLTADDMQVIASNVVQALKGL